MPTDQPAEIPWWFGVAFVVTFAFVLVSASLVTWGCDRIMSAVHGTFDDPVTIPEDRPPAIEERFRRIERDLSAIRHAVAGMR